MNHGNTQLFSLLFMYALFTAKAKTPSRDRERQRGPLWELFFLAKQANLLFLISPTKNVCSLNSIPLSIFDCLYSYLTPTPVKYSIPYTPFFLSTTTTKVIKKEYLSSHALWCILHLQPTILTISPLNKKKKNTK